MNNAIDDVSDFPTIEEFVGGTPLVRLQRIPGATNNVILGKLEGNNPAGSVKDRPALSMIQHAERRGDIKPGDTLIEATSGNTGIALAMAAAIKGYHMVLIMPSHMSAERRAAMKAFGAEIILVTQEEGMEGARDLAAQMEARRNSVMTEAQREYFRTASRPQNIHAMCEDYRAGASIDLQHDEADMGKKIQCPLQVLWGERAPMGRIYDVLKIWKERGENVIGKGLPAGHTVQEDAPKEFLAEVLPFLNA